ncbi:fungal-specific transcription factor domain-containing protein [Chaetomidium leptoderma]|uniref:Fungal-specific transcription factor domain-containing protein n=1 Tax=Chaetomidium leptoderma TaxID=669021 RepID=A0AAN6ZZJ9_9PEZI|nr:fungal-specific transcription factor domain-containing protein [Chaetomidium leptoderma]
MAGEGNSTARASGTEDSPRPADAASTPSAQDNYDPQQIIAMARHPPPGASVYPPTAAPSAVLNPRSCVTCRRRKVRCDKHMPCSNCRRAQIPCIFPAPGRAPRRPRPKDPNAPAKQPSSDREVELMKRLRKLEGIVEDLSGQIEVESVRQPFSAGSSPEAGAAYPKDEHAIAGRIGPGPSAPSVAGSSGHGSPGIGGARLATRPASATMSEADSFGKGSPDVHKQFGRLVLNEKGITRYVSSSLWSSINDEVSPLRPGNRENRLDELRKASQYLTDEASDESDVEATPESADHEKSLVDHQSFILGYRSADVDLKPLHPLPSQIPFIWQVYQENVDPILKVIHVPSMSKLIKALRHNFDSLTPSTEALMFSIYYASITSLDEDEVKANFGTEKEVLIQKYRFAVEQALAKAEFITKPDFTVVQAFMLFLVLVRRHDDTRFAWTLTGLLIRLSQALGLHRDGTHFPNLTPFQVEMRRRLFWAVCVLDLRSAEDQGTDLNIVAGTFDTQVPLNINDSDISPEIECLPEPREGTTDMAFSLIRYEICALSRRLHTVSSDLSPACAGDVAKSLEEREALLTEVHHGIEQRLRKDNSNPIFWAASTVTRIIVAKMTLIIYQPVLFPGPGNDVLSEEVRARLLNAALDVFEYSHVLNADSRCKQWRWLFQTWSHWHALAYALIEVSHRPWGPKAERVWTALNLTFQSPNPAELEKLATHHAVWMPLRKLYLKVKKNRYGEIARLRADSQAARALELQDQVASPTSFNDIPGSTNGADALERWRKLMNLPVPPQEPMQYRQDAPQPLQQPLGRSQTMPQGNAMGGQLDGADDMMKPELMDYLDYAMTSSSFTPADFWPIWGTNPSANEEIARAAFASYPASEMSRVDPSLGFDPSTPIPNLQQMGRASTSMSMPGLLTPQQQQQRQQQQQQQQEQQAQAGMVQTPQNNEDGVPPWLWPTNGSPDILNMPNMGPEDQDINMDDNFDWQNWQENLGRYEVENGGRVGNAWGPGL